MSLTPLFYIHGQNNYLREPRLMRLQHTNRMEQANQFWSKRLPFNSMLARVGYDEPGNMNRCMRDGLNQISNVFHLVYKSFPTCFSASISKALLCPKQKNIVWITNIIRKFTLHGELVKNCCAVAISAAGACLLCPQNRRFIVCNTDLDCAVSSLP